MAAPRSASYAETSPRVVAAPGDPEPTPTAPAAPGARTPSVVHEATVIESGAFARAVCTTCDWRGPARRARAFATADIEEHQLLGEPELTVDLRDHS